jgi:hypothetical protein
MSTRLTAWQILSWARKHYRRTGLWPTVDSGTVTGARTETWRNINAALHAGRRGLEKGQSLHKLIETIRGPGRKFVRPRLTKAQILQWADAHRRKTGQWPKWNDGRVSSSCDETWEAVDGALRHGVRGLEGGSSLPRFLAQCRQVPMQRQNRTRLTIKQILTWADEHRRRTRKWPSGKHAIAIPGVAYENWKKIDAALSSGGRGLPGGSSLAKLLTRHRGKPYPVGSIPGRKLSKAGIMRWAAQHHRRTGQWPTINSGPVYGVKHENWHALQCALHDGSRGLPPGGSLAQLLGRTPGSTRRLMRPRLTKQQIVTWADSHRQRTRSWPKPESGKIRDAPGETWKAIEHALRGEKRGLVGKTSLVMLLHEYRGVSYKKMGNQELTVAKILRWADAHYRRTGQWPRAYSGRVFNAHPETWGAVESALHRGGRGLRKGQSLVRLLVRHRKAPIRINDPKRSSKRGG